MVTLLAIGPAALLMLVSGAGMLPLPALLAAVAAGVALWAGGLILFDHPLAPELKRLAKRVRRRGPRRHAGDT